MVFRITLWLREHTSSRLRQRWRSNFSTALRRYDRHHSFQLLSPMRFTVFIQCSCAFMLP